VSKNLAKIHSEYLYDEEYEGFGGNFVKNKKKTNENVEVKRSKNATTTRLKAKSYSNYERDEDFYYD
jgi:fructose-1-phosphate kinase PfkB-like protein